MPEVRLKASENGQHVFDSGSSHHHSGRVTQHPPALQHRQIVLHTIVLESSSPAVPTAPPDSAFDLDCELDGWKGEVEAELAPGMELPLAFRSKMLGLAVKRERLFAFAKRFWN